MEPSIRILSATEDSCHIVNAISIHNRRGDLPKPTKAEFASLLLQYADRASRLADNEQLVVELPDGRLLLSHHSLYPGTETDREIRQFDVEIITLKQRTPRCLRKWSCRKAWLYPYPYEEQGYTTDPTRRWRYKVWC